MTGSNVLIQRQVQWNRTISSIDVIRDVGYSVRPTRIVYRTHHDSGRVVVAVIAYLLSDPVPFAVNVNAANVDVMWDGHPDRIDILRSTYAVNDASV